MEENLQASLEEAKRDAAVKANELAALQLRVSQIEEALKEDEQKKRKEGEERSAKLLARLKEAEKEKGKGKAKTAEEPPSSEVVLKPAKAKGKRPADYSNLSESQIKRIKEEKRMFGERERKRLKKLNKDLDFN